MRVALPDPYNFELSTERFRAFGPDPANAWEDGRLYRVLDGREVAIEAAPGGVSIQPDDARLVAEVRRFLGSPFDLDGFARFAETAEPVLARLARELRGLRPTLAPDPFEAVVTSITAQQVSLYAAGAIRARFVQAFGERYGQAWEFPSRERIARLSPDRLRAIGFSTRKAEYALAVARASLDLDALAALPDDEVKRELTALPGVGEWTAEWFLARHLARANAWPAGDLGLRKAVSAFYFHGRDLSTDETRLFGERLGEHRNLAAHYLLVGHRVLPA